MNEPGERSRNEPTAQECTNELPPYTNEPGGRCLSLRPEDPSGDLGHGRRIPAAGLPGTYAAFDRSGALIALACDDGAQARSVFGWHSPA